MSAQPISRRRFLKAGCLTVTTVGLTVCGVGAFTPDPPPIDLPSLTYGEKNTSKRVLVAYATYAGSTRDIATAIGETLGARGCSVDVKPIQEKPPVDGYQAVLIGSAVHHGNWLPEAVDFVKANQPTLNRVPVALFAVHIANCGNDEQSQKNRLAYLDAVRMLMQPAAEVFFAGKFDRRGAALLLPSLLARLVPPLDFRDWGKIRDWADSTRPLLLQ
jgi:menaquinone-dependent protoporphyrinogen oxidase